MRTPFSKLLCFRRISGFSVWPTQVFCIPLFCPSLYHFQSRCGETVESCSSTKTSWCAVLLHLHSFFPVLSVILPYICISFSCWPCILRELSEYLPCVTLEVTPIFKDAIRSGKSFFPGHVLLCTCWHCLPFHSPATQGDSWGLLETL